MKKTFAKQWVAGAVALSLIVGGGGFLLVSNNASAADPSTASTTAGLEQKSHSLRFLLMEVNEDLIAFLKLDKAVIMEKLKNGESLASIAAEQGISRDALKAELTKEVDAELAQAKTDFATNIDMVVDSADIRLFGGRGPGGKQHGGHIMDLTEIAKLLNYATVDELKAALVPGKSIADLATEKGIAVQSVIDLQVSQIVKALDADLAANKITQEQYDERKANSITKATARVNQEHNGSEKLGKRGGAGGKGHHRNSGAPAYYAN